MLERVNTNTAANVRLEPTLKKSEIKEAAQTPQARQIAQIFSRCVGLIKSFSNQVQENQDCHDHSLGMRHGSAKVKEVAIPLFQKLKEFVHNQADKLNNTRVIRKFKDMLELLETCDFHFVRHSENPILIDGMATVIAEFLQRYSDFERRSHALEDGEHRSEIAELLAAIAKIPFQEDKFHVRNAMVAEVLTKHLVTRPVEEGDRIELPCFQGKDSCVISYGLTKRMVLGESGIPVLVYAPLKEEDQALFAPLLLFRGTKVNFTNGVDIRSVLENLHKVGPARFAYDQFKVPFGNFLKKWYRDPTRPRALFRAMGYSQGAVLAQRALVDFHAYFGKQLYQESILFNSPALEDDYYASWESLAAEHKPTVIIYLVTNDVVSKRGYRFASDQIYEIKPRTPQKWLAAHTGSKFIDPEWEVFQVDNHKESESPSRKLVNQICSSSSVEMIYNGLAHRFGAKAKPNRGRRRSRRMG